MTSSGREAERPRPRRIALPVVVALLALAAVAWVVLFALDIKDQSLRPAAIHTDIVTMFSIIVTLGGGAALMLLVLEHVNAGRAEVVDSRTELAELREQLAKRDPQDGEMYAAGYLAGIRQSGQTDRHPHLASVPSVTPRP